MKWRNISREEVEQTLKEPDDIAPSKEERMNAFKMIRGRYIKVTYKESPNEILVITALEKEV